ncbi:8375_t:CDS:10 [Paraglomus brasilianum]|uniref:RNA helicase n=1 Tax=Paraglomus brasilianum TaxID=144538 RepID=A0A9N9CX57_9GLOM|nr:8375_t:CDS:10 [Paraglomus brasilianum]
MGKKRQSSLKKNDHDNASGDTQDTNMLMIETKGKERIKGEKSSKEKMNVPKKMSSKKKKRLDNYIKKKLKKEERVVLLEKLSKSSFWSEDMKSSKHIGQGAAAKTLPEKSQDANGSKPKKMAFYVPVSRDPEIQKARMELPICREEQLIMETINENPTVIICGETGSGKTTQVPQFLYEAGYGNPNSDNPGMIGITQPRRVAAVSMSKRVAYELGLTDEEVSYQIRYDTTTSPKTVIKFMTDGVLLRELSSDFLLSKYSVIIIDEAHERNLNTDILIGVVSRILRLRDELSQEQKGKIKPLKIIIMSATLRVSDFTENNTLFKIPPPVLKIEARQYEVNIHFSRRTAQYDYVTKAYKKVCQIHRKLPSGGILVFQTGQNEISTLCKKLRKRFPLTPPTKSRYSNELGQEEEMSLSETLEGIREKLTAKNADVEVEEVSIGDFDITESNDQDIEDEFDTFDSDLDEPSEKDEEDEDLPLYVLPLYSLLSTEVQLRVFQPPPQGTRLCVVATNVAETSLTIPGIKYVVDCGKVKERQYDVNTGVQSYTINWTSKASADQRAGRAGRTGPGHCYRLYSSAVFNDQFPQFTLPEILRMPIEGVVLQMKSMNIDIVANFPFPTPPDRVQLRRAEKLLQYLSALDDNGRITDLGKLMAQFPVQPRFSKMLIIGQQHGCLPYIITIVAALSVGDPFIREDNLDSSKDLEENDKETDEVEDKMREMEIDEQELAGIDNLDIAEKERRRLRRKKFYEVHMKHAGRDPSSDFLKLLNVVGAYEYAGATDKFCEENFVRAKTMYETHKLRGQITNIVQVNCPGANVYVDPKMGPPSSLQLKAIRQIITAGFIDQVAIRKGLLDKTANTYSSTRGIAYRIMLTDEDVYIHPSSVLYHQKPPDFVVYQELQRTSKVWMKGVFNEDRAELVVKDWKEFIC